MTDETKDPTEKRHPAVIALLQYFKFEHLPLRLQLVSKPFCDLAHEMSLKLTGPEATVCIRKLLEAKDCAVRAAL
jgi:hypothetical protein